MPTLHAAKIALIWIAYNVLCYLYLPGPVGYGQETPAGMASLVCLPNRVLFFDFL